MHPDRPSGRPAALEKWTSMLSLLKNCIASYAAVSMTAPETPPPSNDRAHMSVPAMLGLQAGLVVLALVLGAVFRLDLLGELRFTLVALNWSVLATLVLLFVVWRLGSARWAWVKQLTAFMRDVVVPLFRDAPAG